MKKTIFFLLILFIFLSFIPIIQTANADTNLPNPLNTTDPKILITRIIQVVIGFVGVITLGMFIFGGLVWMTSAGNEDKVKKGKGILIWTILGLVVILTSYVILTFFINSIGGITN
jgi:sterol desaturase/sphingolipid hydroxylase (fatty acid hydroxylase superfamily)